MMTADLRDTLALTIDALTSARDPWWIIAGAAVALYGETPVVVRDVDVLMSVADAQKIMDGLGIEPATDAADPLFRSALFGRWVGPPLIVEIMADFQVATPQGWTTICPTTRVPVAIDGRCAYVPDRAELAAMLTMFGRPKDMERARLLLS